VTNSLSMRFELGPSGVSFVDLMQIPETHAQTPTVLFSLTAMSLSNSTAYDGLTGGKDLDSFGKAKYSGP